MGSAKRLRKLYEKPRKLWDAQRIGEERRLVIDYGLKNMRELWRMKTILRKIRRAARSLLARRGTGTETRKKQLLERVRKLLVNKQAISLDDVLSLSTRDILERRLETLVFRKGLAKTIVQARQFVAHGHVAIEGQKNTSPSRLVSFAEERKISWYGEAIKLGEEESAPAREEKAPHAPAEVRLATKAEPVRTGQKHSEIKKPHDSGEQKPVEHKPIEATGAAEAKTTSAEASPEPAPQAA